MPSATAVSDTGNLTHDLLERLATAPEAVALRRLVGDTWIDVTTREFHGQVVAAAKGLVSDGVEAGDRVALIAKTRYEWTVLDYAIWWAGAVTVPVYETSSASQIGHILADSGAVGVFVDTGEHHERVKAARDDAPQLRTVRFTDEALTELADAGAEVADSVIEQRLAALGPASLATIVYTSGTTGSPKGCVLTHANFRAELGDAIEALPELFSDPDSSTLLFLPLAHVFARIIQIGAIRAGAVLGHTADVADLLDHLAGFKPRFVLAVPRVFEKVYNSAHAKAHDTSRIKGRIFDRAATVATRYSRALDTAGGPNTWLRAQHRLFDRLVYAKLRSALGGRAEYAISGGAPLGERLGHFYRGAGLTILEGYGLTETTAALTVNRARSQRIGTVGVPFARTEVRVGDDGEVAFRGPQVFTGYWNDPDATASVLDEDGWFASGDLGEVDADGFVTINGRKKELLITAGGKNVSPSILEDLVRAHPMVSQCVVVGDAKPFIGALITLDPEHCDGSHDDPDVRKEIHSAVDEANQAVSRAEAIRDFVILEDDWTEDNGYLTPSFKVKRPVVLDHYAEDVERLYSR